MALSFLGYNFEIESFLEQLLKPYGAASGIVLGHPLDEVLGEHDVELAAVSFFSVAQIGCKFVAGEIFQSILPLADDAKPNPSNTRQFERAALRAAVAAVLPAYRSLCNSLLRLLKRGSGRLIETSRHF
jgi:hypothetical protein